MAQKPVNKPKAKPEAERGDAKASAEVRAPLNVELPQERTLFQRVFGTSPAKAQLRENMAAVKAGVMQELETMSAEKGVPLRASPFKNVVLPQARRPQRRRGWYWPLVALLLVVAVSALFVMNRGPVGPERVVGQLVEALRKGDVKGVRERVDMANLGASVVRQLGEEPTAENVQVIDQQLQAMLMARAEGGEAVAEGPLLDIAERIDLGHVKMEAMNLAMRDNDVAVVEVPVHHEGASLTLPLQVVLGRTGTDGAWRVTDIPNFAVVVANLGTATVAQEEHRMEMIEPASGDNIKVLQVAKAAGSHGDLLVSLKVANGSGQDVQGMKFRVLFADAAGRPMKESVVAYEGTLKAGEKRERSWSLPVDRTAPERHLLTVPLEALTYSVTPLLAGTR